MYRIAQASWRLTRTFGTKDRPISSQPAFYLTRRGDQPHCRREWFEKRTLAPKQWNGKPLYALTVFCDRCKAVTVFRVKADIKIELRHVGF
jgi:hypothetical protein